MEDQDKLPDDLFDYRYNADILYNPHPDASPAVEAAITVLNRLPPFICKYDAKFERLQRYISLDTHRLEGDLLEIHPQMVGVTKTLLYLGFDYEVLSAQHIPNLSYVYPVLKDTMKVNRELMAMNVVGNDGDRLNLQMLLDMHAGILRNTRGTTIYGEDGNSAPAVVSLKHLKMYPNFPTTANQKIHQYCPPHLTRSHLDAFLQRLNVSLKMDANTTNPYVLAAWCHYAFVNIHPFMVNLTFKPLAFFVYLRFHRMVTGVYHGFLPPLF